MDRILDLISSVNGRIVKDLDGRAILVRDIVPSGNSLVFVGHYQDGSKAIWNCHSGIWSVKVYGIIEYFADLLPECGNDRIYVCRFANYPKTYVFIPNAILPYYEGNTTNRVYMHYEGKGYGYQELDSYLIGQSMAWLDRTDLEVSLLPITAEFPSVEPTDMARLDESIKSCNINVPTKPYELYSVAVDLFNGCRFTAFALTLSELYEMVYNGIDGISNKNMRK